MYQHERNVYKQIMNLYEPNKFNILPCYTHKSALNYFYFEALRRLVDMLVFHTSAPSFTCFNISCILGKGINLIPLFDLSGYLLSVLHVP